MENLNWTDEVSGPGPNYPSWSQAGSNICLDFHGDPARADLVVFSDGNHHMALGQCLDAFAREYPGLSGIFYATTPPGPILMMLETGGLTMGNLTISAKPHVFIGPPGILDHLVAKGRMPGHVPLARNQGNVILVKKNNPKGIAKAADVLRRDVILFMSNPDTEKASFAAYSATLDALAGIPPGPGAGPETGAVAAKAASGEIVYGQCIHHREAPRAVALGHAHAAVVFHHLGLRYKRIFPDHFDVVPLGGTLDNPDPLPGNIIGQTNMGLVDDGGPWGDKLLEFLASGKARQIYRRHGLVPLP